MVSSWISVFQIIARFIQWFEDQSVNNFLFPFIFWFDWDNIMIFFYIPQAGTSLLRCGGVAPPNKSWRAFGNIMLDCQISSRYSPPPLSMWYWSCNAHNSEKSDDKRQRCELMRHHCSQWAFTCHKQFEYVVTMLTNEWFLISSYTMSWDSVSMPCRTPKKLLARMVAFILSLDCGDTLKL